MLFIENFADVAVGYGRVAQLGEHRLYTPEVAGSSPVPPIIRFSQPMGILGLENVFDGIMELWQ